MTYFVFYVETSDGGFAFKRLAETKAAAETRAREAYPDRKVLKLIDIGSSDDPGEAEKLYEKACNRVFKEALKAQEFKLEKKPVILKPGCDKSTGSLF